MFDEATKYFFVLTNSSAKGKDSPAGFLLLAELEKFVNGALEQIKRVERARRSVEASARAERWIFPKAAWLKLFIDAHFYFICIGQVNKVLKQLCRTLDNPKLRKIQRVFQEEFQQEIRDHLEHLDERAVGRIVKDRKIQDADPELVRTWKADFFNFSGDKLTFGGKRYPVNAEAAMKLQETYKSIIAVIREDYALKDEYFVYREMQDKQIRKISRWATKFYNQRKP